MQSNRKRIRKTFAPLTTSVNMVCDTPASPLTQVYNAESGQYEPDRMITPTRIRPIVIANANDGSWSKADANEFLADINWYADGVNIVTAWEASDYEIIRSGAGERGTIIVKKNISPQATVALRFRAKIADVRTGQNIEVESDDVILSSSEKAPDGYRVSIGTGDNIIYDPLMDKLHLYEYKVAHGLAVESDDAREEATDGNSYILTIPIEVHKAKKIVTDGYSLKLYRMSGDSIVYLDEVFSGDGEVKEIALDGISLDLRLVDKQAYLVKVMVDDKEVAQKQFSIGRQYRAYQIEPMNGTDIHPSAVSRADKALALADGNVIECPESIIRMVWYTDTARKTAVEHNEGASTEFVLSKTGIGATYSDSWLETYINTEWKGPYKVITDESGNVLTDSEGNILIMN